MNLALCIVLIAILLYLIITTVVNIILLGALRIQISRNCKINQFLIQTENRIDLQQGVTCSAFASAYVLRHWGMDADGNQLYPLMPNKMNDGYVYPKGIQNLFPRYGFQVKYCTGNLNALKNEICKGNPVIVMLRTHPHQNWLHYVPVVGYDENHLFLAESLPELTNCSTTHYNRKVKNSEFKKLWNTSMIKMPFYRNTYMTVKKSQIQTSK